MKTVKPIIFLLALLMGVALTEACTELSVTKPNWIEPSDNVVKSEHVMAPFDKVDIEVSANVKIIQGHSGDYRVVLSCPDNYVDLFTFGVDDGELDIKFVRKSVEIQPGNVDITVYAPAYSAIENDGVASVETDHLMAASLKVENAGVGTLYLSGLQVGELKAECSGVGNIELSGQAQRATLECIGVGKMKAANLRARAVKAEVSGVGGIECYAVDSIDAEVSGVGSLYYGGQPKQRNLQRSGVGKISRM